METSMEPLGHVSPGDSEHSGHFVAISGKQQHVTPEIKKTATKTESKKTGRANRKTRQSQLSSSPARTPTTDEGSHRDAGPGKAASKKSGRTLFPAATAARKAHQTGSAAVDRADSIEDFDQGTGDGEADAAGSSFTPAGVAESGRTPSKRSLDVPGADPSSSDKKQSGGSKRRRLYSQPVGVIEPAGSVSGSQASDSMPPPPRPVPADAASRANESVYDHLLEHSARRGGRVGAKKVPCGRKSVPPRARSVSAVARAPEPEPAAPAPRRQPRRRASVAAASNLRDRDSDDDDFTTSTSGDRPTENQPETRSSQPAKRRRGKAAAVPEVLADSPDVSGDSPRAPADSPRAPADSPGSAAAPDAQEDRWSEELERSGGEVFYLPTVQRSDDDDSEDGDFEGQAEPPARPTPAAAAAAAAAQESVSEEDDTAWYTSGHDGKRIAAAALAAAAGSPKTSGARQREKRRQNPPFPARRPSPVPAQQSGFDYDAETDAEFDEPVPASGRRSSGRPDANTPSGGRPRVSAGPSWMGSARGASARKTTCYSRARASPPPSPQPSPDKSLRRYSYLSGEMPEEHSSSAKRKERSRSRSRSGSRSGSSHRTYTRARKDSTSDQRRRSSVSTGRPAPRGTPSHTARPFFTAADPESDTPSPGEATVTTEQSASDSVSRHQLIVEQDSCWYRHPRRELGPNVSSESSATRRQQAKNPPRQPRQRPTPWVRAQDGEPQWQPPAPGPWRHSLVPTTLRAGGGEEDAPAASDRQSSYTPPSSAAGMRRSPGYSAEEVRRSPGYSAEEAAGQDMYEQDAAAGADQWPEPEQMREAEPMEGSVASSGGVSPVQAAAPAPDSRRSGHGRGQSGPQTSHATPQAVPPATSVPAYTNTPQPAHTISTSRPPAQSGSAAVNTPSAVRPPSISVAQAPTVARQLALTATTQPPPRAAPQAPAAGPQPSSSAAPQPYASVGPQQYFSSAGPQSRMSVAPQPALCASPHWSASSQPAPALAWSVASGAAPQPRVFADSPPGSSIGSELAQLVTRWRQLARLERQTLVMLCAGQRRQKELMDVQQRVQGARLQESRRSRAGILALCDQLERLAGGAC